MGPPEKQMRKPEREKIEKFQRPVIIDCATKLTTPGIITEICQLVAFRRVSWGGFSVSFFVVMMGKVIEGLNC